MAHEGPSLDLSGKPLEGHCGESDLEQEPGGFPRQSLRAVKGGRTCDGKVLLVRLGTSERVRESDLEQGVGSH